MTPSSKAAAYDHGFSAGSSTADKINPETLTREEIDNALTGAIAAYRYFRSVVYRDVADAGFIAGFEGGVYRARKITEGEPS